MAQPRKAMLCKRHNHLRGFKGFPRLNLIDELLRMDPHHKAELVILIQFNFRKKIAAVYQRESIAFPKILSRFLVTQDHKGILLVAGGTPYTSDGVDMVRHPLPFHLTLLPIPARQADQIHIQAI